MTTSKYITITSKFLNYSFSDIEFDYDKLTPKEKEFCTKEEFDELVEELKEIEQINDFPW